MNFTMFEVLIEEKWVSKNIKSDSFFMIVASFGKSRSRPFSRKMRSALSVT